MLTRNLLHILPRADTDRLHDGVSASLSVNMKALKWYYCKTATNCHPAFVYPRVLLSDTVLVQVPHRLFLTPAVMLSSINTYEVRWCNYCKQTTWLPIRTLAASTRFYRTFYARDPWNFRNKWPISWNMLPGIHGIPGKRAFKPSQ